MKSIITTVGTSIFTNAFKQNSPECYKEISDKPFNEWKNHKDDLTKTQNIIFEWLKNDPDASSAEIKSLIEMQEELGESIKVYLITTDTILSNLSAEILKKFFQDFEFIQIDPAIRQIQNLQVKDVELFENLGMSNLSKVLYKIIEKDSPENCILNITGGFKGVIPYLTIIGQIKHIPIGYIFEGSSKIIVIPQLPIQFDYAVAEELYFSLCDIKQGKFIEARIKDRLLNMNLLSKKLQPTGIGEFFIDYVDSETLLANNIFGFYIESKMHEYFYSLYGKSHEIMHSLKDKQFNDREIDFVIKDHKSFVSVEIKSLLSNLAKNSKAVNGKSLSGEDKIIKQISGQMESYKNLNNFPSEYHYYVYSASKADNSKLSEIRNNINGIFSKYPETKFRMFFLLIKRNKNNDYFVNCFSKFMSEPIKKTDLQEILV